MLISSKYTHADLVAMPEDTKRREILDGDLFVWPSSTIRHQTMLVALVAALARYLERRPVGEVLLSPLDVIFSEFDVLQPDLMFILNEHLDIVQDWVRGVPDLVIEVLSPGSISMDRGPKLKAYARFGVPEYWIVDPEARAIEVYRQSAGGYERVATCGERDSVSSPLLPEFALPVAPVFAV
ncbi:MAG TPA: Uma2 family endonuclease [Terriglobia bacterium]|nr:Uma2 family endonuclease [Terriglobia bacterium]